MHVLSYASTCKIITFTAKFCNLHFSPALLLNSSTCKFTAHLKFRCVLKEIMELDSFSSVASRFHRRDAAIKNVLVTDLASRYLYTTRLQLLNLLYDRRDDWKGMPEADVTVSRCVMYSAVWPTSIFLCTSRL